MYCAFKQLQRVFAGTRLEGRLVGNFTGEMLFFVLTVSLLFFFKLIHPTVRILLCFHDSAKPFYNSSLPSTFNESREIKKTKNKNICKRKTHNRCFRTTLDVESRLWEHSFILGYTLIIDQCVTFPHRQMPSCKGNKGKTVSRQADSRSG